MNSFDKQQLDASAREYGFIRDNFEKVLRLVRILMDFGKNPLLKQYLVLKGGTAINLLIFDMPRLSVDIDFDFAENLPKEAMLEKRIAINDEIQRYMFSQGYTFNPASKNPMSLDSWAFDYINAGGNKDNIKIEINYSMRCHIYAPVMKACKAEFTPKIRVKCLDPVELFGCKIKALLERNAARDLYDVYQMILKKAVVPSRYDDLRKVILFYLAVGGSTPPKTTFSYDAIKSINYPKIRAQLKPVLRKGDNFDFEKAKSVVIEFLEHLMDLSASEKTFIEKFNAKGFAPGFLFEDEDVVARLLDHPMALWKISR